MDHTTFAQFIDNIRASGSVITSAAQVKVVLKSGDIVDVEEVKFSLADGGAIHIIAGPTYDEMLDEEDDETVVETRKA